MLGWPHHCPVGNHGRGQPGLAAADGNYFSLRQLWRLVAARKYILSEPCDQPAEEDRMMQSDKRLSLLQRALGVFVLFAFFLALFLWAGKTLVAACRNRVSRRAPPGGAAHLRARHRSAEIV